MSVSIAIDPNLRVEGNATIAGFEDVLGGTVGNLANGMTVEVFEPESGLVGVGRVMEIDQTRRLIHLGVEWTTLAL